MMPNHTHDAQAPQDHWTRRRAQLERRRDALRRSLCRLDRDPAARRAVEIEAGWLEAEIAKMEAR